MTIILSNLGIHEVMRLRDFFLNLKNDFEIIDIKNLLINLI
jgi:hypothetical protein